MILSLLSDRLSNPATQTTDLKHLQQMPNDNRYMEANEHI